MEDKLFAVMAAILGFTFFAVVGIPLSIEKYQQGEVRKAEIQLEIAKVQASGNLK
jgi:hypothetical protein